MQPVDRPDPAQPQHESYTSQLVVDADGRYAAWAPGRGFTGHPDVVDAAREAAGGQYLVEWGRLPELQRASEDTWVGALSALMYLTPGRTRIVAWPDAVREWWEENTNQCATADAHDVNGPDDGADVPVDLDAVEISAVIAQD